MPRRKDDDVALAQRHRCRNHVADRFRTRRPTPGSAAGASAAARQAQIAEHYEPHRANEKYPPVMLSVDELNRISTIETDIKTLVTEKIATWIVKGGIEDQWEDYVAQLETIGLPEVVEVYQTAYDRFTSNT